MTTKKVDSRLTWGRVCLMCKSILPHWLAVYKMLHTHMKRLPRCMQFAQIMNDILQSQFADFGSVCFVCSTYTFRFVLYEYVWLPITGLYIFGGKYTRLLGMYTVHVHTKHTLKIWSTLHVCSAFESHYTLSEQKKKVCYFVSKLWYTKCGPLDNIVYRKCPMAFEKNMLRTCVYTYLLWGN